MDADLTKPKSDKSAIRLLNIIKAIGKHGPVRLDTLAGIVDLPRSSVHRACQTLQEADWVGTRICDNAYLLTTDLDNECSSANFMADEVTDCQPMMRDLNSSADYNVALGSFVGRGRFSDIENTVPLDRWVTSHSLVTSSAALAALTLFNKDTQVSYLRQYLETAPVEEKEIVEYPAFFKRLRTLKLQGHVWNSRQTAVSVPWRAATGTACAVTIEMCRNGPSANLNIEADLAVLKRRVAYL